MTPQEQQAFDAMQRALELRKLAIAWRDYKLNNLVNTAEHIGMLFVHKGNFERAATPHAIIELVDELVAAREALSAAKAVQPQAQEKPCKPSDNA